MIRLQGAWRRVASERLGVWQGGSTPSKKVPAFWRNGSIPWVSPKDFGPAILASSQDRITEQAVNHGAASLIDPGSLLLVVRSNVLKHSLPVSVSAVATAINQDVKALTPGPGVNAVFLRYQIESMSEGIIAELVRSGTTVQSVDDRLLRNLNLILAPINEQDRIVQELDAFSNNIYALRESLRAASERVNALRGAVLQELYDGELTWRWRERNGIPNLQETVTISSVVESIRYGSSRKSNRKGEVAVLRMGNIQDGQLDWNDLVYTSDQNEIAKYALQAGDVLFNRTNSPSLVGKTALYDGKYPAIAAGYLIVVRCGDQIRPAYLVHLLNSPAGRAYSHAVKSDGVSQSNINAKKVGAFSFVLPSLAEQDEALRIVGATFLQIEAATSEIDTCEINLRRLRAQVLTDAFDPVEAESCDGLTDVLDQIEKFKEIFKAERTSRSSIRMTTAIIEEEVERVLRDAGAPGLRFDRLADQIGADYETLKIAVFKLLSDGSNRVRQRYDDGESAMKLEFVGP